MNKGSERKPRTRWAVLSDFDGTIVTEDLGLELLKAFADPGWEELERAYEAGEIDLQECLSGQFALIRRPRAELEAFVGQRAQVRPGFAELTYFCRQQNIPFLIVSGGLDFYIQQVLDSVGLGNLDYLAARTRFTPQGIEVALPSADGHADFKVAVVRQQQGTGYRVAYIGDWITDYRAAQVADFVFARDKLLDYCRRHSDLVGRFQAFNDFKDVHIGLRRLLDDGLSGAQ